MVIYERYKSSILSYVSSFKISYDIAEQVTQDVFIKLYQKIEQFRPEQSFKAWLWAIARNSSIDYLRKKDALHFTIDLPLEGPSIESLTIEYSTSEEQLINQCRKNEVKKCMDKLTENTREVLSLRVFSELSYGEIAAITNYSLGKVKTVIHRAKKELKTCLKKQEGSNE